MNTLSTRRSFQALFRNVLRNRCFTCLLVVLSPGLVISSRRKTTVPQRTPLHRPLDVQLKLALVLRQVSRRVLVQRVVWVRVHEQVNQAVDAG